MSERETIANDLRVLFAHNLRRAASAYGIPEEHVGSFAAVLTMADYLNAAMPLVMKTDCLDASTREMAGGGQGEMKHPIAELDCSGVLKGCLREVGAEYLEDIESYKISKGGIVTSVEYFYLWVKGTKRSASSMANYVLEQLKRVYLDVLGRELPMHE